MCGCERRSWTDFAVWPRPSQNCGVFDDSAMSDLTVLLALVADPDVIPGHCVACDLDMRDCVGVLLGGVAEVFMLHSTNLGQATHGVVGRMAIDHGLPPPQRARGVRPSGQTNAAAPWPVGKPVGTGSRNQSLIPTHPTGIFEVSSGCPKQDCRILVMV